MDEPLPAFDWRLSASESLVLLWGPETGDAWALKVALLELTVRRALTLGQIRRPRLFRSAAVVNVLQAGDRGGAPPAEPLLTILDVHSELASRVTHASGVPVTALAMAAFTRRFRRVRSGLLRHRWDRTGGGYVQSDVLPSLSRLGYYAAEESMRMGLFFSRRWRLTSEGEAALTELRRFMAIGRDSFPVWVEHDPESAVAYVERSGPSILLLGGIAPLIRRLGEQTGAHAGSDRGGSGFSVAALAGVFGPGPHDDIDAAFFALSADVDRSWGDLHQSGGFFIAGGE